MHSSGPCNVSWSLPNSSTPLIPPATLGFEIKVDLKADIRRWYKQNENENIAFLPLEISFAATSVVSLNPPGVSLNQVPGQQDHHPSPSDPHLPCPEALLGKRACLYITSILQDSGPPEPVNCLILEAQMLVSRTLAQQLMLSNWFFKYNWSRQCRASVIEALTFFQAAFLE